MANDVSLETLQNNKFKTKVIMYMMIGLILIALGAVLIPTGGASVIAGGLAIGGGGYMGYTGYNILVDPKNERKCSKTYFSQVYKNVIVPKKYVSGDAGVDTEFDVSEIDIITKAQYGGYGGVFLVSNVSTDSIGGNFDAYYIPGNANAILTHQSTVSSASTQTDSSGDLVASKLYIAADAKTGNRVIAKTDDNTKSLITNTSPVPTGSVLITPDTNACPNT